jgi:hypothetical protein
LAEQRGDDPIERPDFANWSEEETVVATTPPALEVEQYQEGFLVTVFWVAFVLASMLFTMMFVRWAHSDGKKTRKENKEKLWRLAQEGRRAPNTFHEQSPLRDPSSQAMAPNNTM